MRMCGSFAWLGRRMNSLAWWERSEPGPVVEGGDEDCLDARRALGHGQIDKALAVGQVSSIEDAQQDAGDLEAARHGDELGVGWQRQLGRQFTGKYLRDFVAPKAGTPTTPQTGQPGRVTSACRPRWQRQVAAAPCIVA